MTDLTTTNWTKIEAGVYETQVAGVTVQICNYRGNESGSRNGIYWAFNTFSCTDPYHPLAAVNSDGEYDPTLADAKRHAERTIRWALEDAAKWEARQEAK
tara:strand:+ start:362 stop:661 length:300 start_codon:yes stop_codon:yes gene_type:complete